MSKMASVTAPIIAAERGERTEPLYGFLSLVPE